MLLNQVTLAVGDLDRSVGFYRKLGLSQIVADAGYARFMCPDGGSTLSLELAETAPASATTVYFECDQLDATVAEPDRAERSSSEAAPLTGREAEARNGCSRVRWRAGVSDRCRGRT